MKAPASKLVSPLSLLLLFALGCSSSAGSEDAGSEDAGPPPEPSFDVGPHAVGHSQFTAIDAARGERALLVDVWYPADATAAATEPFTSYPLLLTIGLPSLVAKDDLPIVDRSDIPLLIFSHGYNSIHIQSTDLMEALASHGFIVISPEHTGNAQASPTDSFDEAAAKRVPDISFLIDEMLGRDQDAADFFHDHIDEATIGVIGNSFGAMTALGMASGWAGAPADARVKAIVPISGVIDQDLQSDPRMSPNAGFTEMQLNSVTIPVMLIGGTADTNVLIANNQIAYDQLINAPNVYKVDVIGANHYHFAAICPIGNLLIQIGIAQSAWPDFGAADLLQPYSETCTPDVFPVSEATRLASRYSVAFFRHHLLGDSDFEAYLQPAYAESEPAIAFTSK